MKTVEKILGVSSIAIILIGFYTRFPFMALIITFALTILSLLYFGFSFALLNDIPFRNIFKSGSFNGISSIRMIGTILTGFVFSVLLIGILFKFQLWPFADTNLLIGIIGIAILVIITFIKLLTSKDKFYYRLLVRTLLIGIIGLFLYSLPYEKILELRFRGYPEYVEAEKKLMSDPENEELKQKAWKERQKMSRN